MSQRRGNLFNNEKQASGRLSSTNLSYASLNHLFVIRARGTRRGINLFYLILSYLYFILSHVVQWQSWTGRSSAGEMEEPRSGADLVLAELK